MIPVNIDPDYARPYFRQLASAVGYLHERGITHNDIKPANILLSHSNVPVLVDFGFAQRWNVDSERTFLSNICWGTPEVSSACDPTRVLTFGSISTLSGSKGFLTTNEPPMCGPWV